MGYYQKSFRLTRELFTGISLLALLLFAGCQRKAEHANTGGTASIKPTQSPSFTPQPATEANIYVDEAMLARPYAIIGGTVENVGAERLEKLSVEIELRRRVDNGVERREVAVEPSVLERGKQGRFRLKVLSEEWSGSRVVSLRSGGSRAQEVAFKSLPGAKRPPEKIEPRIVVGNPPPRKKADGGDFINTPDTPFKVP
jgi:hypothetical protein